MITIIRPLALIEEKDIVYYARAASFWRAASCCPHADHSKRSQIKQLLRNAKKIAPRAQVNLFRAVERTSGWTQRQDQEAGG